MFIDELPIDLSTLSNLMKGLLDFIFYLFTSFYPVFISISISNFNYFFNNP